MSQPKFQGEAGRPAPPDGAIYQIPIVHNCVQVGLARLTPDGKLTIAPSELGLDVCRDFYKSLKRGDATSIDISLR